MKNLLILVLLVSVVGCVLIEPDDPGRLRVTGAVLQKGGDQPALIPTPDPSELDEDNDYDDNQDDDDDGDKGNPNSDNGSDLPNFKETCEIFSQEDKNSTLLKESFGKLFTKCTKVKGLRQKTLSEAYVLSQVLLDLRTENSLPICDKLQKKVLKNYFTLTKRKSKEGYLENPVLIELNSLTKSNLDRLVRELKRRNCINQLLPPTLLSEDGEEKNVLSLDKDLLTNTNLELMRVKEDGKRKYKFIEKSWDLYDSKSVPGWKVKAYKNDDKEKNCSFLELVKVNDPKNELNGKSFIELDAHCVNKDGMGVQGQSLIELSQKVVIPESGYYKLTLHAMKRAGKYGKLEFSIFNRRKDKVFTHYPLPSEPVWSEVCHEVYVDNPARKLTLAIKDGGGDDRMTLGLYVDNISFTKGRCPVL